MWIYIYIYEKLYQIIYRSNIIFKHIYIHICLAFFCKHICKQWVVDGNGRYDSQILQNRLTSIEFITQTLTENRIRNCEPGFFLLLLMLLGINLKKMMSSYLVSNCFAQHVFAVVSKPKVSLSCEAVVIEGFQTSTSVSAKRSTSSIIHWFNHHFFHYISHIFPSFLHILWPWVGKGVVPSEPTIGGSVAGGPAPVVCLGEW